jgi:peptidoglycan L-alanyl-D-glutamate endopeptidase CwlK
MSYKYALKSKQKLETCHNDIQLIFNEVIKYYDITILEGIRTTSRQVELYNQGKSKLDGIIKKSKHQGYFYKGKLISFAIDVMPYKKNTNAFSGKEKDNRRFYYMAGVIKTISKILYDKYLISHKIRWGGDWNNNDIYTDQTFDDLCHFELII